MAIDPFKKVNEKRAKAQKLFVQALRLSMEADFMLGHCQSDECIEDAADVLFGECEPWHELIRDALKTWDTEQEKKECVVYLGELILSSALRGHCDNIEVVVS